MNWTGFEHGMGVGGWLTNYKRFNVLPTERRLPLTIGDMEHFHTYITEWDVRSIAGFGCDHIRLGFDQIVVERKPGIWREETMELIVRFADWCRKYGLRLVLNLHKCIGNYCDIPESVTLFESEDLQARFVALWMELEKRLSGREDVAFELLNEVRDIPSPTLWNQLYDRAVREIRKQSPERKIIIGASHWNNPDHLSELHLYGDPNIAYTFHCYEPFSFTHQRGVLQERTLYYNREMAYPGEIEPYRDYERVVNGAENAFAGFTCMDRRYLEAALQPVFDFQKQHPNEMVYLGEFGTIRHCKRVWRENWMRDMISIALEHGIPYCVWNYLSTPNDGNRFSLVDDDTRNILSPDLLQIIGGKL